MVREAHEEIGLKLNVSEMTAVHVMHRQTNRLNLDIFFDCSSFSGVIENREPQKCERLEFFPLDGFPSNMVDYNAAALRAIANQEFYSEWGWSR